MVAALQFFMGSDEKEEDSDSEAEVAKNLLSHLNLTTVIQNLIFMRVIEWKRHYQGSWYGRSSEQEVPKARKTNGKSQEDFEGSNYIPLVLLVVKSRDQ